LGDVAVDLVFLCAGVGVAAAEGPEDPELFDLAGEGEEFFDGGVLACVLGLLLC
jgi:hypothetical protein